MHRASPAKYQSLLPATPFLLSTTYPLGPLPQLKEVVCNGQLMSVGGMPVGTQVMGQPSNDARVTAIARWLLGVISPVVVG